MAQRYHSPGPGRPGPLSRNASADPVAPSVALWINATPAPEPRPEPAPKGALLPPGALQRPTRG